MSELDPNKTILVVKKQGKEIGRIPATAPHAEQYLTELVRFYGGITVDYEPDITNGMWRLFYGGVK